MTLKKTFLLSVVTIMCNIIMISHANKEDFENNFSKIVTSLKDISDNPKWHSMNENFANNMYKSAESNLNDIKKGYNKSYSEKIQKFLNNLKTSLDYNLNEAQKKYGTNITVNNLSNKIDEIDTTKKTVIKILSEDFGE